MRTLKVVVCGLLVLVLFLALGWALRGSSGIVLAVIAFLPAWLACALTNLWVGVKQAGYSVRDEFQVLCIVFAIPALTAWGVWWLLSA